MQQFCKTQQTASAALEQLHINAYTNFGILLINYLFSNCTPFLTTDFRQLNQIVCTSKVQSYVQYNTIKTLYTTANQQKTKKVNEQ